MAKVIENWVKTRLGIVLAVDSPKIGEQLYDGNVYYNILKSYNVINKECLVEPTKHCSTSEALFNLLRLCSWFQLIGISEPKFVFERIAQKDKAKCLWLLFQLFVSLEEKSVIALLTKQKTEPEDTSNFNKIHGQTTVELTMKYKSLKERIVDECKKETRRKRELIKNKGILLDNKPIFNTSSPVEPERSLSSRIISSPLPQNRLQRGELLDEILKLRMSNKFLHEIWALIAQKKEKEFQSLLVKKLNEHRIYEQNLATRLLNNYNSFKEHFSKCSKVKNENDPYIIKNETLRNKGIEIAKLKQSILMLHECLYNEKLELKYVNRIKLAQDIVVDLVDLAIVTSEYNNQNGIKPTRAVINDWKELFYKGIPFFLNNERPSTVSEETESEYDFQDTENMTYEDIRTMDTQLLRDRVISKTLVEFYVHSYLYLVGQWAIEQWAELGNGNERLNTLGFVIHRLLECKYPFPHPPEPVKIRNFKIRSVIKHFMEPSFLVCLQELLKQSGTVLIKFNEALQYCISTFENELAIITIGRSRLTFSNKTQLKKVDSRISADSKSSQFKTRKSIRPFQKIDKSVQFPQVHDSSRHVKHSPAGNIGKLAKELISKEFPIDNILSTKIMVEYIKSLKTSYSGFVLTDFPNNVSQAVLLEFLITGRPIETEIDLDKEVSDFMFNEMNPPVIVDTRRLLDFDLLFSDGLRETTLEVIPTFYDILKADKVRQNELLEEQSLLEEVKTEEADVECNEVFSMIGENADLSPSEYKSDLKTENETDSAVQHEASASETANENLKATKTVPTKKKRHSMARNSTKSTQKPKKTVLSERTKSTATLAETEVSRLHIEEELVVVDPYIKFISSQELANLRTSKILPRPNIRKIYQPNLETFFKSCVADLSELNLENEDSLEKLKLSPPLNLYKTLNILFPVGLGESKVNPKEVARLIMREPTEETNPWRKKSEELFGKTALDLCNRIRIPKAPKARPKEDSLTSHRASNKQKQSKTDLRHKGKSPIKEDLILSNEESSQALHEPLKVVVEHTPPPAFPNPGDQGWNYMSEPLSEEVQISLASHWEIVEYVYLQSVYHVMNLLHVHGAKFFPFRNFIRNTMDEDIDANDSRQQIVSNFQVLFNDVSEKCRKQPDMKCELHCKVHELWNLLCELADENKRLLENQLKKIMEQGRIIDYCFTLTNIYLSLMQIEIDRYVDTVDILNEYYLWMLKEEPHRIELEKIQLHRISIPSKDENNSNEDQKTRKSSSQSNLSFKPEINDEIFLNGKFVFKNIIDLVIPAIQEAAKISSHSLNTVKAFVNDPSIGETLKTKLRKKRGRDLWATTTIRKYEFAPNLQVALQLCDSTESPIFRQNEIQNPYVNEMKFEDMDRVDKIKWEWYTAVQDEGDRMQFRIKLIETKMNDELDEIFKLATTLYNHYVTDIVVRYYQEQRAIDQLSKVLKAAVDGGYSIRPKLILEKDQFYMDSRDLLYPDIAPPPPTPLEFLSEEYRFSMSQIDRIVSKMGYVAPQGILLATFVLILEDMITYTSQDHHPYLPINWRFLDKNDVEYILEQAFGKRLLYDWREFIIFNMNLPLPDIKHLLDLKNQYESFDKLENETITYDNYINIPLWFESMPCNVNDKKLVKYILFKLFQVDKTGMNYSAMLFAFCKGEDGIEGFMKALTLVDIKGVLIDAESYKYRLDIKKENEEISRQIINQIIYDVLNKTEGITITTLPAETSFDFIETENENEEEEQEEEEEEEEIKVDNIKSCTTIGIHPTITPNPTYPERYFHPKWHVCIPIQIVSKVLSTACNLQNDSNSFVTREDFESVISCLYQEGKNDHIQAYKLAQSESLNAFFETTGLFKWCNMSYYVQQYLKSGSLTGRFTSSL